MLHIHRNWNAKKVLKKTENSETFVLAITYFKSLFTGYNFFSPAIADADLTNILNMEDGDAVKNFDME